MESRKAIIAGKQLAVVIKGWLRSTPDRLWGKDANYERLKVLKRQGEPVDPRREVADYIAARLEEVGWEVSYPEAQHLGSPPPHQDVGGKDVVE